MTSVLVVRKSKSSQVKYRLLHGRLERLKIGARFWNYYGSPQYIMNCRSKSIVNR